MINKLFTEAKLAGISEIDVYRLTKKETSISIFNHSVDSQKVSVLSAAYYRGAYNGHLGSIYVENDNMSPEEIINAIKNNAGIINIDEPYFIYSGDKEYPKLNEVECDFNQHTLLEKTNLCLKLAQLIESYDDVDNCPDCTYEESYYEYSIINSNGLNVSRKVGHAVIFGEVVAKRGDDVKSGYDMQLVHKFAEFDLEKLAANAVKDTVSQLGASPIASGIYPVVVKNSVMRSLLGAFSSVFSAESCIRKMSFLEGKEMMKVFGDNISIIDDPLHPLAVSQTSFDDEGVAARSKVVVENGVFKTFLHNLKTAKMMGKETTGNGFKASVSSGVGVLPSNLYIKPLDTNFDDLVSLCNNGVYLTNVAGLHSGINVISGDFSLQSQGYVIRDGKICEPINLIVTSGNIKELLSNVIAVGNDLDFKVGSMGSPSLLVKGLSISGK